MLGNVNLIVSVKEVCQTLYLVGFARLLKYVGIY